MRKRILACCLAAFISACVLIAQTGNGSISGQVKDQSGAVIPGATISIKNTATNVAATSQTNDEGRFAVLNLIPGTYTLTASFQGFKNLERGNIGLQVGGRVDLDLTMEVGSSAERVTVTGEVALLRTEDAQMGLVIDNKRIQELPQYDRNPLAFAMLAPNVTGSTGDLRINGGRTGQTEYFLDGVPLTTGYDRGEFENLFNHMNTGMPDSTISNSTFGLITGQSGNSRRVLIAAKIYF